MNFLWRLSCPPHTPWKAFQHRGEKYRFDTFPLTEWQRFVFPVFSTREISKRIRTNSGGMADNNLEGEGDFVIAGYNPPWIPGFLARNEVMIKIKDEIPKTT